MEELTVTTRLPLMEAPQTQIGQAYHDKVPTEGKATGIYGTPKVSAASTVLRRPTPMSTGARVYRRI